jgi:hypothetical protein
MKAWKIAGLPKPQNIFFTSFDKKKFIRNPFYQAKSVTTMALDCLTPVNGKKSCTLFGTRLRGISALVITLSS